MQSHLPQSPSKLRVLERPPRCASEQPFSTHLRPAVDDLGEVMGHVQPALEGRKMGPIGGKAARMSHNGKQCSNLARQSNLRPVLELHGWQCKPCSTAAPQHPPPLLPSAVLTWRGGAPPRDTQRWTGAACGRGCAPHRERGGPARGCAAAPPASAGAAGEGSGEQERRAVTCLLGQVAVRSGQCSALALHCNVLHAACRRLPPTVQHAGIGFCPAPLPVSMYVTLSHGLTSSCRSSHSSTR